MQVSFPGRPYLKWAKKVTPPTRFYAYGGSFRSAIEDCQVDRYVQYDGSDRSRDDVGFRLVVRPEPEK